MIRAYAKGADGVWHLLTHDRIGAQVPAACGSDGPWSSVTTLPQRTGRCASCELAVQR